MLKCKDIVSLSDRYIDGELTFKQRISFRMHLALCKHCNKYIKQMSLVICKLKSTPSKCDCADDSEIDAIYNLIHNIDTSSKTGDIK